MPENTVPFMRRRIPNITLSVVGGYATMFIFVFVTFTVAYFILGADGAFRPGSWDVSGAWIVVTVVLSFIAAYLGGMVCARIDTSGKAPLYLIGLIIVLGIVTILITEAPAEMGPRASDVDNFAAMTNAQQPDWVLYVNPLIGALGVAFGCGMIGRSK